jgi:hypothetical protein
LAQFHLKLHVLGHLNSSIAMDAAGSGLKTSENLQNRVINPLTGTPISLRLRFLYHTA